MKRKIFLLILCIAISASLWYANYFYSNIFFQKGFWTFLFVGAIYFLFKFILKEFISKRIKDYKAKYSFKKTLSILYLIVLAVNILIIWAEDTQVILVAYGLVAAGIAISLQDFFKNFVGGILIFLTGIYRVGDRIETNSNSGDVIDIGILYITLMEIKEWVAGEQPTGRLKIIPNGYVLSSTINNYTKDYEFIWDELQIPLTYESDWKDAYNKILNIVKNKTQSLTDQAEKGISKLGEKYYLIKKDVEPNIFLTFTDNWITFNIRYITDARGRGFIHNKLSQLILEEINKSEKIRIASATLNITSFPDVNVRQNQ